MFKVFDFYKFLPDREKKFFILVFVGVFFGAFLEMLSFSAIIPVFQLVFSETKINILYLSQLEPGTILILFVILFFFKNLFLIFFNYFYIKFIYDFCIEFSNQLFLKTLKQNYSYFKKNSADYFLRKVSNDVINMRIYIVSCVTLITEILFVICVSAVLIYSSFIIFIFVITFFIATISLYFYLIKNRIKNWSELNHTDNGRLQSIVNEGIKGIKDITTYNLQKFFFNSFSSYTQNIFSSQFKLEFVNMAQRYWMELLCVIVFVTALLFINFSGLRVFDFLSIFALYGIAIFRLVPSFNKIINNKNMYKFYYPGFKSVIEQLTSSENFLTPVNEGNLNFQKFLEIKNLSFKFEDVDNFLINNLSFKIKKNSSTLIKGANGSGKSTLLDIISGLRNPSRGDVLIDGEHNLINYKTSWMHKIAFVQQNVFIMKESIVKNITFEDDSRYDKKKFKNICNMLKLDSSFDNFQSLISIKDAGLDGSNLSGGQKQLVSIARALYKDSEVLILDEPDSALDKEKNKILLDVLMQLKGTKTIIMISHNLSDCNNIFDNILEINK